MNGASDFNTRRGVVLAGSVFAATGLAGLSNVLLPIFPRMLEVDMISGIFLTDSLSSVIRALLPPVFVYGACKRVSGFPFSTRTISIVALTAAILGRYVGISIGYVLLGRRLPTLLVLVSSADLAAREFGVVMWVGVALGILGVGVWGAVGAFGGIGLFNHTSDAE